MTKSELIKILKAKHKDLPDRVLKMSVELFFIEIVNALKDRRRVELRGFGTLSARQRDRRMARNPRTGDKVELEPHVTPYFRAGKELRELVNIE